MSLLDELHLEIDGRVNIIRSGHPDWLCRMGCDGCCRRLAEVPRLTLAEWDLLKAGLVLLPQGLVQEIIESIAVMAVQPARPIVCPLLDLSTGSCRVYAYRPVACRTYGFYVQRELGLFCGDIASRAAAGGLAEVVWGNQNTIDRHLLCLGETRDLTDWFADWAGGPE